ncbi:unnamed protein product [Rangifer tarandus platyrhynchus]|uniref:Uncharacterized protein n=1 Tax=Rangifer tarandus platyrhynchus TaxID=3082113 RepID=A0AC59YJF1_RANTA
MVPKLSHLGRGAGSHSPCPSSSPLRPEHLGWDPASGNCNKHPGDSDVGFKALDVGPTGAREPPGWAWQHPRAQDLSFDPYQFHTPLCHKFSEGVFFSLPSPLAPSACRQTDSRP